MILTFAPVDLQPPPAIAAPEDAAAVASTHASVCQQVRRCLREARASEKERESQMGSERRLARTDPVAFLRQEKGWYAAQDYGIKVRRTNAAYWLVVVLLLAYVSIVFFSLIILDLARDGTGRPNEIHADPSTLLDTLMVMRKVALWSVVAVLLAAIVIDRTNRLPGKKSASRNLGKMIVLCLFVLAPLAAAETSNKVGGDGSTKSSFSIPSIVFWGIGSFVLIVLIVLLIAGGSDVRSKKAVSDVEYLRNLPYPGPRHLIDPELIY